MKKGACILLAVMFCFAFNNKLQKKIIRENGFDIECCVTLEELNSFNNNKTYYWFKSGEIHQSVSSSGGFLLHKQYSKYSKHNQLVEQGEFKFGLKIGTWKMWHTNGQLKANEEWVHGYKNGNFKAYDSLGSLVVKGRYKDNLKDGYWIDFISKDTTYYKNSFEFEERPKAFIERFFRKKDSLEKIQIKLKRITKRKKDSIKRVKTKLERQTKKRNDSIKKVRDKSLILKKKRTDSIRKSLGNKTKKGFFNRLFNKEK